MATFNKATWSTLLINVFNQLKEEPFFLKAALGASQVFSPATTLKWRMIHTAGKMAQMGLRGDPSKQLDIKATAEDITFTPPQIFERDYIESTEALTSSFDLTQLANLTAGSDISKAFMYLYGIKLQGLKERWARRIEYMYAQLLLTGAVTFTTAERTFTQDYATSHAGTLALTSTTDPLADIGEDCEAFAQAYGQWPNMILLTPALARSILAHDHVEKYISKNTYQFGLLKPRFVSPSVRFMGSFQEFGIPDMYVYAGTYVSDAGVVTNYIPETSDTSGKMILLNTDAFALGFGAVIDFELRPDGTPLQSDVIIKERIPEESEGHTKTLSLLSYPLPILWNSSGVQTFTTTIS